MIKMLPLFLFACAEPSEYDVSSKSWSKETSWSEVMFINIGKHDVKVKFHGLAHTPKSDMQHVQLASRAFMTDVSGRSLEECVDRIHSFEVFHVPCAVINESYSVGELKDYPVDDVRVLVGLTVSEKRGRDWDRSDWDFSVAYCYDDMVKLSKRVNYETDGWWRELSLAHEVSHVWQTACNPLDDALSPGNSEKIAWKFHESYKETAQNLHVSY
tara:strand:+ start:552 stop:1193 length:642 start_codon:yes stop_codon:yes gene_type:complete